MKYVVVIAIAVFFVLALGRALDHEFECWRQIEDANSLSQCTGQKD